MDGNGKKDFTDPLLTCEISSSEGSNVELFQQNCLTNDIPTLMTREGSDVILGAILKSSPPRPINTKSTYLNNSRGLVWAEEQCRGLSTKADYQIY